MIAVEDLKKTHRATWAAGDYAAVAERIDEVPPRDLLERVPVRAGDEVLDVATGTGNVALPAAAAGANVVGLDITPELFDTARERASAQGVDVEWVEGDAEDLPFDDERFEVVLSVFGVQFAPRHQVVADELARVTRPNGRIGLDQLDARGPHRPDVQDHGQVHAGSAEVRLGAAALGQRGTCASCSPARRRARVRPRPQPVAVRLGGALRRLLRDVLRPGAQGPPAARGRGALPELREELHALAERHNEATDGSLLMNAEYLVTVGRKAG